ncbi:MAG TPA: HEAT repeat domain-containing protein, partial [Planctomycetota bacterium]|nr:HEAT repeat domain-containing protein [Planctomycetota bacterium]
MPRASRLLALLLPLVGSCAQPSRKYSGEDRKPLLEAARLEAGGGPEAAALLAEALRSPFARVRERALRALSRLEPAPDPAPFEAILRTDRSANVRRQAAHALGTLRGAPSPALLEALRDADPGVRRESVRALSWLDDTPPAAIEGASRDPDPLVRREAIFAMARTRSPLLEARIAEGVRLENDESVRWGFFKVLAWRPEAARGLEADLLRGAADPNWLVALHALAALRRGTRADGVDVILRLLERRAF